jgi:hypothetical protein
MKRLTDMISIHTIPAQMLGAEFPIRRGVYTTDFVRDSSGRIEHGIYIAKFRQDNGRIPLLQDCEGEYNFEGFGTFTHLELNEIESNRRESYLRRGILL